jgi:UDPglucose 6-dehydrogenase
MLPHSPNNHEPRPAWPPGRSTRIGVIGAGQLGLLTAIEFADRGHHVVWADDAAEQISAAPELAARVQRNAAAGRLRCTCSRAAAARHGEVIVMAVASPQLLAAAVEVAQNLTGPAVIVDRGTDSAATADRVARLLAHNAIHDIALVSGSSTRRALRTFLRAGA